MNDSHPCRYFKRSFVVWDAPHPSGPPIWRDYWIRPVARDSLEDASVQQWTVIGNSRMNPFITAALFFNILKVTLIFYIAQWLSNLLLCYGSQVRYLKKNLIWRYLFQVWVFVLMDYKIVNAPTTLELFLVRGNVLYNRNNNY